MFHFYLSSSLVSAHDVRIVLPRASIVQLKLVFVPLTPIYIYIYVYIYIYDCKQSDRKLVGPSF